MSNYNENDQTTITDFILQNLPSHKMLALATVGADGKPWAVCVHTAFDMHVGFIWRSQVSAEHSKNIQARPDVSICAFSNSPKIGDFGFYCNAVAKEVGDEAELTKLLAIFYQGREVPKVSEFTGDSLARLYYALPTEAWVTDDRHKKTAVDLEVLRKKVQEHVASRTT